MSEEAVSAYINADPEPKRSTLEAVRKMILELEPNLEQVIAWNAPMFRYNGKYFAGLCAFKSHLTFSPQSADVMAAHAKALEGYITSKNSFKFAIDKPLPKSLLSRLIKARLKEVE